MSTTYNGDGTIPQATAPWAPIQVIAVDNTTPIKIHTASPHSYNSGDTVDVIGTTISAAEGTFQITVTTTTAFTLNGTTAGGAAATTSGRSTNFSVNPLITLPSDGDPRDVSSVNPALEASANIVPYLYSRAGRFALINEGTIGSSFSTFGGGWAGVTATTTYGLVTGTSTSYFLPVVTSDVIEIAWQLTAADLLLAATAYCLAVGVAWSVGSSPAGAFQAIPQSAIRYVADYTGPVSLRCRFRVGDLSGWGGPSANLLIGIMCITDASTSVIAFVGAYSLDLKHYRINT